MPERWTDETEETIARRLAEVDRHRCDTMNGDPGRSYGEQARAALANLTLRLALVWRRHQLKALSLQRIDAATDRLVERVVTAKHAAQAARRPSTVDATVVLDRVAS